MINIINNNIRGGYCCVNKHFDTFDNPYTLNDKEKIYKLLKNRYCLYLDANMLYSSAMKGNLPFQSFRECNQDEIKEVMINIHNPNFDFDALDDGYWIYLDLVENNLSVQKLTDDFPLALENVSITKEHLSDFTQSLINSKETKSKRLIGHHGSKKNYLTTSENLQFYIKYGIRISKVHNVFTYKQKKYLNDYIDFNTEQRKNAKNIMETGLFKLMNNSVYGKLMTSSLNYAYNTRICTKKSKFIKLLNSEKFKQCHTLSNTKAMVITKKTSINMNFPTYIGFHILEKSKYIMNRFVYEFIYKNLSKYNPKIYYTDTDLLITAFEIDTNEHIQKNESAVFNQYMTLLNDLKPILDTSNFNLNHPFYNISHKNQPGFLKSEFPLNFISEFCGLSPKCYSLKLSDYSIRKMLQIISEAFIQNSENYVINCVFNEIDYAFISINDKICPQAFINMCKKTIFHLEPYYKSKVTFIDNIDQRKPCNKIFYDNEFYNSLKQNRNINDNYYYFEISTKFDIFIYLYSFDMEVRPIDNTNISEWTLLYEKTKTCKGAPMHLRNKMSHSNYIEMVKSKNSREYKISFNIIKNDKGLLKMFQQKKNCFAS